jgi:uncharacterized membrane protein
MGSFWDFGLKQEGKKATKAKPVKRLDLRTYGIICVVLALILAVVFIAILISSGNDAASKIALVLASLLGPLFLGAIGIMLIRMAKH